MIIMHTPQNSYAFFGGAKNREKVGVGLGLGSDSFFGWTRKS